MCRYEIFFHFSLKTTSCGCTMGNSKRDCRILFLLVFSCLGTCDAGQFKVIVPAEPVDTTVGSSIVLPCRLSPEMSAAAMEVRWFKENFDNLVFLYKEGKETEGSDYRSRVRLFRQEMERGNVSLLLQNVRISDQGLYKCHVSSVDWYEEPQLQLRVTHQFKVSISSQTKVADLGSSTVLACHIVPEMDIGALEVRWFRQTFSDLVHLYKAGREMQGPDYRGRVRLLKMRKGDVSLLLERVTTSDKGIYTCHVSSGDWYDELSMQLLVTSTFKLIVPSEPVAASVDSDVVLPCQLSPEMSATAMDVRWYRENFENLVFLYKEGKETEGSAYRGRVRLFKQEMERGNVSLLLQNVRISDQGSYTCHVSSAEWYEEPKLGLRVRRQGNRPEIEIGEIKKDSLKLTCHSEGWFPEPQMFWTDKGGRKLSSDVKPASQPGKDSPYSITSHLYMKKTDNEGVVCMVAQQEQKIEFGSRLRISDTFFENIHPERYHLSAFLLPATLVLVCLVAVGIFVKRNKEGVQGCRLPSSGWR